MLKELKFYNAYILHLQLSIVWWTWAIQDSGEMQILTYSGNFSLRSRWSFSHWGQVHFSEIDVWKVNSCSLSPVPIVLMENFQTPLRIVVMPESNCRICQRYSVACTSWHFNQDTHWLRSLRWPLRVNDILLHFILWIKVELDGVSKNIVSPMFLFYSIWSEIRICPYIR